MPPKKKKKKGGKKSADADDGDALENLVANYKQACKLIGTEEMRPFISHLLGENDDEEDENSVDSSVHLLVQDMPLRPSHTRALAWAIMGNGQGMNQKSYKRYDSIAFVRTEAGNAGATSFAELMRLGKPLGVEPKSISFIHCNLTAQGCSMLGKALENGANDSLVSLTLDYNQFRNEGLSSLIYGLRSNQCIEYLSLRFCKLEGAMFGATICDLLSNEKTKLNTLNLEGNALKAKGLSVLSRSLRKNKTLTSLDLSDNGIDIDYESAAFLAFSHGLESLANAIERNQTLRSLNFRFNTLGKEGVKILIPVLSKAHADSRLNKTLKKCFVSSILDKDDFAMLNRNEPLKKGGGKKKGKKKK
jgi:hypothetical protein